MPITLHYFIISLYTKHVPEAISKEWSPIMIPCLDIPQMTKMSPILLSFQVSTATDVRISNIKDLLPQINENLDCNK